MSESRDPWRSFYHMTDRDIVDVDFCPTYNYLRKLNDRYEGEEHLAMGGMKEITKAFDLNNSRTVAIARPLKHIKKKQYDAFIHEAQLTSHLDHPNIIKVFDLGIDKDECPYFTMELKVGDNLKQHIMKQKISEADAHEFEQCLRDNLEIFIKVCDAIAYAHSVNVIHLDLKPANIQVGQYGEVLVCDWGLGKLMGGFGEQDLAESTFNSDMINEATHYGEIKGTPGYMAPEQVIPNAKKNELTDIYALGGILYYILCQSSPMKGDLSEIIERTKKNDIVFPAERCPHQPIPKSLDAVVRKAMALKPNDRYQEVEELRKEVHQYLRGFATQAEGASFYRQLKLLYQRNRLTVLSIMVVLVVFIAVVTFSIVVINEKKIAALNALKKENEALALYQNEKMTTQGLNEDFNRELTEFGKYFTGGLVYYLYPNKALDQGEAKLRTVLKKNPDNESAWLQLGYIYFLRQRFKQSLIYLSKVRHLEDSMTLMLVSQKYADLKKDGHELLKPVQLEELTQEFHPHYRKWLLIKMLAYDHQLRTDFYGYDRVIKAYLKFYNPESSVIDLVKYLPKEGKLSIRGNIEVWGLQEDSDESFDLCLLQIFPLDYLDVRHSGLKDLEYISSLKIKVLDIRDNDIADLSPIADMTHLKTLIVSIGQFSVKEILKIPEKIKIERMESSAF